MTKWRGESRRRDSLRTRINGRKVIYVVCEPRMSASLSRSVGQNQRRTDRLRAPLAGGPLETWWQGTNIVHIERIQIEEGFLDGLDLALVPGLNVLIGARGTGKTSLIELVRFCLGVEGYTSQTAKRSREHALSVLGSGQVTVTLSEAGQSFTVTRASGDPAPRTSGSYQLPIILSQTEIETLGMQPGGRLQLLDSFIEAQRGTDSAEAAAASGVRSATAEVATLRREIEGLERQLTLLPTVEQQLQELAPSERQLEQISTDAAAKKRLIDGMSESLAGNAVASSAVERFSVNLSRWQTVLASAASAQPALEKWPAGAGEDVLAASRQRIANARGHLQQALAELSEAVKESSERARAIAERKLGADEKARQLRKEIEALQAGAGSVARQGQQLREQKAQLESLKEVLAQRQGRLFELVAKRNRSLDQLEEQREKRSQARLQVAMSLNKILGPRIQIRISRLGQYDQFASLLADALRGSGLRYNDLAPAIAAKVSPRELLEAIDSGDADLVAEAAGISKDRAARALAQLRESDLGALATVYVDDAVEFQLLDGTNYKDISQLSTGQRCTVVLPLVLRHAERLLIVDQPEDHIDNAFIAETLIQSILNRSSGGQLILSTHNANIPVLGEANRVIQLGSDGRRGFVLMTGPLDAQDAVRAITSILEGGAAAFQRRAQFYNRQKKS